VNKGELLFVVDWRPYKLALDAAQTKLNLTKIEIKTLHDSINAASAQLASREVDKANIKQYLDRILPLRNRDFVTENEVVETLNKPTAAQAGVGAANSELFKGTGCDGSVGRR
jgi:multidrug resistance efflux pump